MTEVSGEDQLSEVKILQPTKHWDDRGYLSEVFNVATLAEAGVNETWVQENHTLSMARFTVRGLHFQIPPKPSAKLIRVVRGAILDVAVDVRSGSPTFGRYVAHELDAEDGAQMYVPPGFAHGYCTLSANTEVSYFASAPWDPGLDRALLWSDPGLGIPWPMSHSLAVVSDKDREAPVLSEIEPFADPQS